MYGPTTASLIAEGACVLLHDYRSGTAIDWSGQGNTGTLSGGCRFTGPAGSLRFHANTDEVTVADAPELQLTAGSIVVVAGQGGFLKAGVVQRAVSKKNGAVTEYYFIFNHAGLYLYSGATTRSCTAAVAGKLSIGVTFTDGAVPIGYVEGIFANNMSGAASLIPNTGALEIGNSGGTAPCPTPLAAVLVANRILTPTEMAAVHAELVNAKWPSKQRGRASAPSIDADMECHLTTGWGYNISPAAEGGVTGQRIGGDASPFRAGDATFRASVATDTIDGKTCKVLTCSTAGKVYIPASLMRHATPAEAAYGTFDLYGYKADASAFDANIIATVNTGITTGYGVRWAADESVVLYEYGVGNVIAGGTASHSAWHRFRVTRSLAGLFTLYIDGVSVGTGTDITTLTSTYMVFDLDAGDKLALGDVGGDHGIIKMLGVVAP